MRISGGDVIEFSILFPDGKQDLIRLRIHDREIAVEFRVFVDKRISAVEVGGQFSPGVPFCRYIVPFDIQSVKHIDQQQAVVGEAERLLDNGVFERSIPAICYTFHRAEDKRTFYAVVGIAQDVVHDMAEIGL